MISRDRDGVYAEGGSDGAPRAKQVADGFHLVRGLIRVVQDELAHQREDLLIAAAELLGDDSANQAIRVMPEVGGRQQRRGPRLSSRQKEVR